MINRIVVRQENMGLRAFGYDPCYEKITIKDNGFVRYTALTENLDKNLQRNGFRTLSSREFVTGSDKIPLLFKLVNENLNEILAEPEIIVRALDGDFIVLRFYEGLHRVGQVTGEVWGFNHGDIIQEYVEDILSKEDIDSPNTPGE